VRDIDRRRLQSLMECLDLGAHRNRRSAGAIWSAGACARTPSTASLGHAAATNGRIGLKHFRALKPLTEPTGWH
jgi:hypothetical protein